MHASEPRAAGAAMEEARSTLLALESWEGHWPGAKKCKDLLVDLVNTASEAIAHGKAFSATSPNQATNAGPAVSPVSNHERRRSVTIVNPAATITSTGRTAKGRRRTQSRDPVASSSRRMAAVSPYRVDGGQRARSSSRRRGRDDTESLERPATGPFYQSFSSPTLGTHQTNSSHSSPGSVNLPSPPPAISNTNEPVQSQPQDPSPLGVHTSKNANNFQYGTQVSPAQIQPPQRYDIDYGVQPMGQWNGTNGDQHLYPTGATDQSIYGYGTYSPLDMYQGYEQATDLSGGLGITSAPTSATYPTSLPFRGLDFIRNYNLSGYGAGEQDSLWQSYDPGAFGYDPDLAFTLGDTTNELHDTVPQS